MTTEEILKRLNDKGIKAIVMVKANKGYSVIPMAREIYSTFFILQKHWNDKTIKKALNKLLTGG